MCSVLFCVFFEGIQTFGKNVVVAGRSKNVGMPISMLLHTDGEHERPGGKTVNVVKYFNALTCKIIKIKLT